MSETAAAPPATEAAGPRSLALDAWHDLRRNPVFWIAGLIVALMVLMAAPTLAFAFGDTKEQLFASRLILSSVGASFVVGIHMTALWFKPRDIGFAEGFYAGWGNFGSAAAAMTLPTIALTMFGGDDGWRYAVALSGVIMGLYGVFYWFAITDGPSADTHKKPRKASAIEVSSYRDLIVLAVMTVPMIGILSILVWRVHRTGYIDDLTAITCYFAIAAVIAQARPYAAVTASLKPP